MAPQVLVNCVAPGLLEGTRATANLREEQLTSAATLSLLLFYGMTRQKRQEAQDRLPLYMSPDAMSRNW